MTKEQFEQLSQIERLEVFVQLQSQSLNTLVDCITLLKKRVENLETIIKNNNICPN